MAGSTYFAGVALVHALCLKLPGLYVYFNVPSNRYQDGIISFLCVGWSTMFFAASRERSDGRQATFASLISGMFAIIGLALINIGTDFHLLAPEVSPAVYWMPVMIGGGYWFLLASLVYLTRKTIQPNQAPEATPTAGAAHPYR